jgi:UDP-N-acetylmuramoyl-tripeptide--D-alanyl-D-alanine ligase
MLELGDEAPALHAGLAESLSAAGVDSLFVVGALMDHLWNKVPAAIKAGRAADARALAPAVIAALRDGDIVMVKGSNGSKVSDIVAAIKAAATTH